MIDTTLLLSFLVFASIMLLLLGVFYYARNRREHHIIIGKIRGMHEEPLPISTEDSSPDNRGPLKKWFMKLVTSLGNRMKLMTKGEQSYMRKTFLKAGYTNENALIVFLGFKALLAMLLPAGFFLIKVTFLKVFPNAYIMVLSILLALVGYYLPNLWLMIRTARRKEKILEGFPDALDLMVVCVEAGMGLDAAIHRVGEEIKATNKVLGEEFRLLSLELRAGKLRQHALRNLAMRADLEDVTSLVTLLQQTDKFGTSVAQSLRVHADSMRTRRRQRAEEIAAKLPAKLVFPLILFIFPSLFVVILGPAMIQVYRTFLNR